MRAYQLSLCRLLRVHSRPLSPAQIVPHFPLFSLTDIFVIFPNSRSGAGWLWGAERRSAGESHRSEGAGSPEL